jgi:hypothetical protein
MCTSQFSNRFVGAAVPHSGTRRNIGLQRVEANNLQSAFAIVADGFDRTSFHGFLAKRLLLRRGRLLKHIGVAAVVDAREISRCGFPVQVAVNALVIDVKLSGDVFRVFIRNPLLLPIFPLDSLKHWEV